MNEIKNQRGIATLEIVLVVAILGTLSAVAVPKMARIVDKVCLDYEMKHLYSDLNLARSIGKSSTFDSGIFQLADSQQKIELWIYGKYYSNANAKNRYQIMRTSLSSSPYHRHKLTNGIELDFNHSNTILKISFDNSARYSKGSQTLTLNSKFGNSAYFKFDTVGRWRGTYEK